MSDGKTDLTLEEKRGFYRDGFVILKDIVPKELTFRARRKINKAAGAKGGFYANYHEVGGSDELTDLINMSALGKVMRNVMGPYDPPKRAFAAVLYPRDASYRHGIYGVPEDEIPNYAFDPHLDGSWTSAIPQTAEEVDDWNSPRTEHFGDGTPLFQNPERTVSLASYTTIVGVALNDQTEFGRGNFCVLKGAHHEVEKFFRTQRDQGGPVGPEGPGWPRLIPRGDGVGLNYLPDEIRRKFADGAQYTPDGTMWPKPTPVLLDEGDAVFAMHAIPHCGSRNAGADPRMNVYLRLRRRAPGRAMVVGDSDHPDRKSNGEFRDHDSGYDPFQDSLESMCDHWREWEGMAEVVAEERAKASE